MTLPGPAETPTLANGNDGNYLLHCVEVEAAVGLARTSPNERLHVAHTQGMAPFGQIGEPNRNACRLLYGALRETAGEPKCSDREIVKAYRKSWKSQECRPGNANLFDELKNENRYPNSAELSRAVIGTNQLSSGITGRDKARHKELAAAWIDSAIVVARSSWGQQMSPDGALSCPDHLDALGCFR